MALNETDTSSEIFDEDDFLTKLDNLKSSKNAIESLSTWIIFHKNYHETICQLWFEKLNESKLIFNFNKKNFNSKIIIFNKKKYHI